MGRINSVLGSLIVLVLISYCWAQICPTTQIEILEATLDAEVHEIVWLNGRTNPVAFILTENYSVYRSNNAGKTWISLSSQLGSGSVSSMYTAADQQHIYLLGRINATSTYGTALWVGSASSLDLSLTTFKSYEALNLLTPHYSSEYASHVLGVSISSNDIDGVLHVSKDYGKTFQTLAWPVKQAFHAWGTGSTVWYLLSGGSLVRTDDFGVTEVTVMNDVWALVSLKDVLFAAKWADSSVRTTHLYTGENYAANNFTRAHFPAIINENAYSLVDISHGSIFIAVRSVSERYTATLYQSDSIGQQFSVSLPLHLLDASGESHFQKVHSVPGVHLANTQNASAIKTMITFDNGAVWQPIRAPTTDVDGRPITCQGDCNLQLHLAAPGYYTIYPKAYSTREAVGLIIANGNVGPSLLSSTDQVQTYMSTNAGLDWTQVSPLSNVFGFADHGSLVLMVQNIGTTNAISYSWNEGKSWSSCGFTSQPVAIDGIETVPTLTSEAFLMYGVRNSKGYIAYLDFSGFHERDCTDADYEDWTPTDTQIGQHCFLGQNITYKRKIPDAECFNPDDHEAIKSTTQCGCQITDYECDYCYELYKGKCVPACSNDSWAFRAPSNCNGFYNRSIGYRLIPGDVCDPYHGNVNLLGNVVPCPNLPGPTNEPTGTTGGSTTPKGSGTVAILIAVFCIIGSLALALVFAWRRGWLDQFYMKVTGKRSGRYRSIAQTHEQQAFMNSDDSFDDDDLGTDAPVLNDEAIGRLNETV